MGEENQQPGNGDGLPPSLRQDSSPSNGTPNSLQRLPHQNLYKGFSDTVSNVVEIVKEERGVRRYRKYPHSRIRRGSWSASTSPNRSPSPIRYTQVRRRNQQQKTAYGTTSLRQRSRSPSPARLQEMCERDSLAEDEMGNYHVQHNYPGIAARRRLPPTPCKPSILQLNPSKINFPILNASPTHTQHSTPHSVHSMTQPIGVMRHQKDLYYSLERERMLEQMRQIDNRYECRDREREEFERECNREQKLENERLEFQAQLSFEEALALGRTGCLLQTPPLNSFNLKDTLQAPHSNSDEEDWC